MSETPLPPPRPGAPPPPPPPPDLVAPPGYAGYRTGPIGSVPLKRIGGVARAAVILVAATSVASLFTVLAVLAVSDDAQRFLDGEIDRDEYAVEAAPYAIASFLYGALLVASAVLVIIWMYRIAVNLRTLHRGTTWGPGWTIGGWFLPPFLFVIPFLVLREQWRASDPDVPVGGEWRAGPGSPLVTAWFVVFGPIQFALQVGQLGDLFDGFATDERALAEQITGSQVMPAISAAVTVVAGVLYVLLARRLTDRHRRLTGEAG